MSRTTDQKKDYLCAICKINDINEKRTCKLFEGSGDPHLDGDMHGFDPNTYTNYRIEGGKLFAKRPNQNWDSDIEIQFHELLKKKTKELPIGGICTACLEHSVLLYLMEHIRFENKSR